MTKTFAELEQAVKNGTGLHDLKDQLRDYVYSLSEKAFTKGDAYRDAIKNIAELKKRQDYIKECFLKSIGGLPEPSKDLNAEITGTIQFEGYKVEKIVFTPRENVYATANMYIPDGIIGNKKNAAVIFTCGHWDISKRGEGYQIVCQYLVRAGLIVFALDPVGQGERYSYINTEQKIGPCTMDHDYAGFQCIALGKDITRYFLHDIMRAFDYLASRPEINPDKIGITGTSGGGTQSCMMMLADKRIAAAAPSCFIMNRKQYMKTGQAQDREQIWRGLTEWGIDHEDFVLVMAPKPVMIVTVIQDFFPVEAADRTYNRCARFWEMHGKKDNINFITDDYRHRFTSINAKKAAVFFVKHLLDAEIDPDTFFNDSLIKEVPDDDYKLNCTPTGQVQTSYANSRFIYDENKLELEALIYRQEKERLQGLTEDKLMDKTLSFLRGCIEKNRVPVGSHYLRRWLDEEEGWVMTDKGLAAKGLIWLAQEDVRNTGMAFINKNYIDKKLPVTIMLVEGGTHSITKHLDYIIKTCGRDRVAIIVDVTGIGMTLPRQISFTGDPHEFYGVVYKLNDDLLWLGDSLAALRTFDLLRFIDIIWNDKSFDVLSCGIEIYTHGRYSVYADFAKFIDGGDKISKVISDAPLTSYKDFINERFYERSDIASVILPGLLDYADLDDIRRWNGREDGK